MILSLLAVARFGNAIFTERERIRSLYDILNVTGTV